jgi:hypothetical protein
MHLDDAERNISLSITDLVHKDCPMRPSVLKERLSALYTEKAAAYKAQCEGDNIPDKVVNRFVNKPSQIIGISLLCTVHRYIKSSVYRYCAFVIICQPCQPMLTCACPCYWAILKFVLLLTYIDCVSAFFSSMCVVSAQRWRGP